MQQCQKKTQIYAGKGETVVVDTRIGRGLIGKRRCFSGETNSCRDQKNSRCTRVVPAGARKNDSLADHIATNQGGFVCLQPAERTSFSKTRLIRFGLHHFALSQSDLLQLALLFNCLYSVPAMDIVILF